MLRKHLQQLRLHVCGRVSRCFQPLQRAAVLVVGGPACLAAVQQALQQSRAINLLYSCAPVDLPGTLAAMREVRTACLGAAWMPLNNCRCCYNKKTGARLASCRHTSPCNSCWLTHQPPTLSLPCCALGSP